MVDLLLFFIEGDPVQVPALFENPWFLALWGWVVYNFIRLFFDQKKYDKDSNGLGVSEVLAYVKFSWIGMLVSLMLLPFFVPYAHDIWLWSMDLAGKDWKFTKLVYGFVGLLMVVLQYGALWLKERFTKK